MVVKWTLVSDNDYWRRSIYAQVRPVLKTSIAALLKLEPFCCKKLQNKSPNQETGLGNRGHLKVLKDTKLLLDNPYFPNLFLVWDFFLSFLAKNWL